jgi:iron(III) transport system substrate-binding protein
MIISSTSVLSLIFFIAFLGSPWHGLAAPLPKSTQEMLKRLKLNPSILADIDRELEVPREWVERARKEGKLRFMSTEEPQPGKVMLAPFRERYPFIEVELIQSTRPDRIKTLVAYKSGRILVDIQDAISGIIDGFIEARALEDLQNIPNMRNLPEEAKEPDGLSVVTESGFRCIGYNTKHLKKEELPKKWEEILTQTKLKGGNLALGNRPELWAVNLWGTKGEDWTKDFLSRLFSELKPQLRKEGMNAMHELVAAGEYYAFIPAGEDRTYELALEGAPVGFACPEPVPRTLRHMSILKGTPNLHAARIFVNWLLSKEGQIAKIVAKNALPVHKDLMRRELIPWADQVLGKSISWPPKDRREIESKLDKVWSQLWLRGGK